MNIKSPNFKKEETPLHMERPMEYPTWMISIISIPVHIIVKFRLTGKTLRKF